MPINPRIMQRVARDKACKICLLQLAVAAVMSYGVLHELWKSPFPKNILGKVFKYSLCAFSVMPIMTYFFECCVDPVYCDPTLGHSWSLRLRDLIVGAGYWCIGFWLPAEAYQNVQDTDEAGID